MKEKKIKILLSLVMVISLLLCGGGTGYATVTGACVNCHTMHNSQGGAAMATFGTTGGTVPNATLLRGSCIGCHGQLPAGANNIITDIPQVSHADGNDLAGGNFKYMIATDAMGHNVEGLKATDGALANDPPGYASAYDPATTDFSSGSRLTCAGSQGCHGNRDVLSQYTAVSGAHHDSDAVLKFGGIVEGSQGASVATSYRFLLGVQGGEDTDWQDTSSSADHNEYKGATYSASRATMAWADVETISQLCSECHGNFHLDAGVQEAVTNDWIRHPTDYVIPASGEYTSISAIYNTTVPVARATIPTAAASSAVTAGTDIVMCLSCHRAHASEHTDILRWDYSGMVAGTTGTAGTGCFVCHTNKDG